jgi:hypothetical protein
MSELRDPTHEEMESPIYDAIWEVIKNWNIAVPGAYSGYHCADGSHIAAILDSLKRFNIKKKSFYEEIKFIDSVLDKE